MKKVIQGIVFILCVNNTFSQADSVRSFFKVTSFAISGCLLINQSPAITQNDYRKIAPENSLVNVDLKGYNTGINSLNGNGGLNLIFGFKKMLKNDYAIKSRTEHRIGIRFYRENILPARYNQDNRQFYDSLKINGVMQYDVTQDSTCSYMYSVINNVFMFDLGSIYQSNPKFLLQGYVGYNIGLGSSFNSYASTYYSNDVSMRSSTKFTSKGLNFISEDTPIRNSFIASAALVYGGSLRLARTKKFWNKTCLNIEGRFGVNSQNIPNYKVFTRLVISGQFGLKFLI